MEGDKARVLMESMDKLTTSINRLITILDDAQKDIIDEYQQSKPAEKLGQLLDQNEMIARALIAISDNLNGTFGGSKSPAQFSSSQPQYQDSQYADSPYSNVFTMPSQNASTGNPKSILPSPNTTTGQPMQQMNPQPMQFGPPMQQLNQQPMQFGPPMQSMGQQPMQSMNPQPMQQLNQQPMQFGPPMQSMGQQPMQFGPPGSMDSSSMMSMDDLPPMDNMPPLDNPVPNAPKKKFLGIM